MKRRLQLGQLSSTRVPRENNGVLSQWTPVSILLLLSLLLGLLVLAIPLDRASSSPFNGPTRFSLPEELANFSSATLDELLESAGHSLDISDIPRNEPWPNYRGTPERADLPLALLFTTLGLSLIPVPPGTRSREDDSPRVRFRVCRARPPTFHFTYY